MMKAIRTEKTAHATFHKQPTIKATSGIRVLSAKVSAKILAQTQLKIKAKPKEPLDAEGRCSECEMPGHDATVHKIVYCGGEIVTSGGVVEEFERFRDEGRKQQLNGRFHVHHKGRNKGALRQKGKLTTGIHL